MQKIHAFLFIIHGDQLRRASRSYLVDRATRRRSLERLRRRWKTLQRGGRIDKSRFVMNTTSFPAREEINALYGTNSVYFPIGESSENDVINRLTRTSRFKLEQRNYTAR